MNRHCALMRGFLPALVFSLLFLLGTGPAESVELNDVYRMSGKYRVTTSGGVRVYYPERCDPVMPRVMATLRRVKDRMTAQFPSLSTFEVSVILIDHDDRETSTADPNFDTITIGLTEEIGALSTRGYSFEDRFALRLAHIMILRTLGPAKTAIRRRLGVLSMPPWFIEGMALYNAFPMDSLHVSRLYDMARSDRMYSMNDLALINSRESLVREEMSFQAHALMNFLHARSKPDAGYHLMRRIAGNPARFDDMFREAFGMSLKDAFREFSDFVKLECKKRDLPGSEGTSPGEFGEGGFYQGLRRLPGNAGWIWVSSAKRREEVYDLWRLGNGTTAAKGNARTVLENVHPGLLVDSETGTTYIGKYIVNDMRQRRLSLWAVPMKGRPFQVVDEPGSFRPLRISAGRLWYLNVENGMTRVRSVPVAAASSSPRAGNRPTARTEFEFPPSMRPLDVALDTRRGRLLYIQQEGMMRQLMGVDLPADAAGDRPASGSVAVPVVLFTNCGLMRYPSVHGDDVLFCAETQNRTLQLFRIPAGTSTAIRLTRLPGGVWDYDLMEDGTPLVITLKNGGFRPLIVDLSASLAPLIPEGPAVSIDTTCSGTPDIALGMFSPGNTAAVSTVSTTEPELPAKLDSRRYTPEYRSSFWLPKMNRDDQGAVFGVYSYRADRLDRNRLEFSPTYGFKSKNWGYTGNYQHRFDLFKVGVAAEDRVVRKS
ncbi:hypothetical protein KBA41_18580, partial [Candidatus Ozemobacteraceae bacterium]|nr:hypothetical protein [Candidatus Ozemobacteraceae bacterium]